jgi:hypothetical protein
LVHFLYLLMRFHVFLQLIISLPFLHLPVKPANFFLLPLYLLLFLVQLQVLLGHRSLILDPCLKLKRV